MTKLTWLSHGSWLIETGSHRILLDPFLRDNPAAKHSPDDLEDISYILVSHGHFDHIADVAEIAKRDGAIVVCSYEIAEWFGKTQDVRTTTGMNIGGSVHLPFGEVKMVPALHSNSLPDGSYGGQPSGFVITLEHTKIYFACDTAFFGDMKYYAQGVDVAVLPIGDLYTMGIEDSVAAVKIIDPKTVLPAHYGTWPPIDQNAKSWAARVMTETSANAVVLKVGEAFEC